MSWAKTAEELDEKIARGEKVTPEEAAEVIRLEGMPYFTASRDGATVTFTANETESA